MPTVQQYGIREDDLQAEVQQVRRLLERKNQQGESAVNSTLDLISML